MEGATKRQDEAERERLTKKKEQRPGVGGVCSFLEVILYEEWTRDYSGRLVFLP
jgi:hypothetical protein